MTQLQAPSHMLNTKRKRNIQIKTDIAKSNSPTSSPERKRSGLALALATSPTNVEHETINRGDVHTPVSPRSKHACKFENKFLIRRIMEDDDGKECCKVDFKTSSIAPESSLDKARVQMVAADICFVAVNATSQGMQLCDQDA
eukprot:CAMPEP_0203754576 /NCGR_PEP_ID=MMETSP0098-20131031/8165_1 /ASSEMBLY_ACC=CAM_ASM_000208 /TAXON_ID=96639 /ORGANISM=" , Strain NY0313808BC1" /LENGTH=142 /DNA_ID=CAMNT_0050645663 /DNA_START=227 /DNA_END=656 /DNA_ORIENTATION=-